LSERKKKRKKELGEKRERQVRRKILVNGILRRRKAKP